MNIEDIEGFLTKNSTANEGYVKITFKKRDPIYGLFIKDRDYSELKSKNFWRIVTRTHFEEYGKSKNMGLARIFHGSEFSRLTLYKDSFEV
ncbi:MAG TPA: short-chain dehydrogenase [Flavisolibacter sp.]|nr:short-chain dehydrogenase [Flavisolibacter sp.]